MKYTPLPEKLRPVSLKNFVGQKHLVGPEGIISKLLQNKNYFPSLIFWGPPGSGKTTLARIIAKELDRDFFEFSAVNASIKEIQKKLTKITNQPVVFIDEIHRFNKAQQDKLLPFVERGDFILIGATTENPSFEVIRALLSRTRVVVLNQHTNEDLIKIIKVANKELSLKIDKLAQEFLIDSANGDARVVLNVLEIANNIARDKKITVRIVEEALQRKQLAFDKQGEEFYNVISAFIKSMRASQVDAALYYLARMVESGQDPLYIARRMVIFASEDIGMAQPTALVVANEVFKACETIGYPECAINLAHGVVYLTLAKKDRSSYDAYFAALKDVQNLGNLPIPMKIRNAPTKLMQELGYHKGYKKYDKESYLPDKIKHKKYYQP